MESIARLEPEIQALTHFEPATLGEIGDGPLSGIAVGIKDIFDTSDMPTTYGSPIYGNHQPKTDAALVSMLRRSGATIAAKTVTTEFAFFHPGPTRNPHNFAYSPGGSSSGSVAGVAAGYFPAAIGTQTGGSVIRPAAYCGVAGYKPSFGLFPVTGSKCFSWSLDTVGFFAATVADAAFIATSCSGFDMRVDAKKPSPPRIGVYRSHVFDQASAGMQDAFETSIRLAERAGARVTEITPLKALNKAYNAHPIIQNHEAALACAGELQNHVDMMSEKLCCTLEAGQQISIEDYNEAQRVAKEARQATHALFTDIDILLTPSAPDIAPFGIETTGEPTFNKVWTLLGLPCVSVPGLVDQHNMPLGMQIIAPYGQDRKACMTAHWLEQVLR
jgi:Asp-tRNA(Asn)/Glu-tRNA(Gln) amidotransferase A subunit family amidase